MSKYPICRIAARFHGRVQGVCFRAFTREQAEKNHLTGWVRNCADGSVEAVFEGEERAIDTVLDLCRQGPPGATVTRVDIHQQDIDDAFSRFEIRY